MRRVHYSLKLLVCFMLAWVSFTFGPASLEHATGKVIAAPLWQTPPPPGGFAPTGGPFGGTVNALLSVPGGVLAATGGGVFYTMDNGESWTPRNNGLTNLTVNALALVGALVYAGTLGGVFQSNNNGLSWTPLNLGLTVLAVLALSYIGSTLFAGTNGGGLFAFINGQWTPRNTGLSDQRVNAIKAVGTFILLGTLGGVFRSENSGSSWLPVNVGLTALAVTALACIGTTVFAGTQGGVFRSENNGGAWLPVNSGLTNLAIRSFFEAGTLLYAATAGGLFRTANNGGTWTALGLTGLTARAVRAILITGTLVLIGTLGGGIFASANQGQSWVEKNNGLSAAVVRALVRVTVPNCASFAAQTCEAIYAGTLNGIFCSLDKGRTWHRFSTGLSTPEALQTTALVADDTNLYCGTNDGVYRVRINETVWTKTSEGIPIPFITTMTLVVPLPPPPTPPIIVAGTSDGLYRSADRGLNWTPLNNGLTNRQILAVTTYEGKLYAGSNGGGISELVGETWQPRNGGDLTGMRVSAIHGTNADGGTLLIGTPDGEILRHKLPLPISAAWQRKHELRAQPILILISPNLILPPNGAAHFAPAEQAQAASFILAGTQGGGALVSTNQGESWQAFNNGLANPNVFDFAVSTGNVFAATGGGVYLFASPVATVSAASFSAAEFAPESIAAAFGANLATATASGNTLPLPTTLAGTRATIKDSAGLERATALFFASPNQLNLLLPLGTADGPAQINVTNGNGTLASGTLTVTRVAPGLFAANANGQGVAAAVALRVRADGSQSFEPVARLDAATNRFVPLPIDLGPAGEQVFLLLFGTGFRFRSAQSAVSARIGGTISDVSYAGAQGELAGLDQANVLLPRALAGRGEVEVALTVDGKAANPLRINVR